MRVLPLYDQKTKSLKRRNFSQDERNSNLNYVTLDVNTFHDHNNLYKVGNIPFDFDMFHKSNNSLECVAGNCYRVIFSYATAKLSKV